MKINGTLSLFSDIIRYNLKIIFANKFIYFFLAAVGLYLLIITINILDPDAYPDEASVFYILLIPGLLLIFYPTAFGIQNDLDTRMMEMLVGIPNYRYKIWLVRLVIIYLLVYILLLLLSMFSILSLVSVPVFSMAFQLMFPIFFFGMLTFMLSTYIRNGNGTAALVAIVGLFFFITSGIFEHSKWNIFLNPFQMPSDLDDDIWREIIFYNRVYLLTGSVIAILIGLFRLQNREKLVS